MPLSFAFAIAIASLAPAATAHAQILPVTCLDRHSHPTDCPRDSRPVVSGAEAERNLERAQRSERDNRRSDTKVIDYRNGRFGIFSRPAWEHGYCSAFVQTIGLEGIPNYFEHRQMPEAACAHEANLFSHADVREPFEDVEGDPLICTDRDAQACADGLRFVREVAAQAQDDARVSFGHESRDRAAEVARFQSMASSRALVIQRIDRSVRPGYHCVRAVDTAGFQNFDDGQAVIVCGGSEGGHSMAWVFYEGATYY